MDDLRIGKCAAAGEHGFARLHWGEREAFGYETWSGGLMNRTGDAVAGQQLRVGGVHDGLDVGLPGDVAHDAFDPNTVKDGVRQPRLIRIVVAQRQRPFVILEDPVKLCDR